MVKNYLRKGQPNQDRREEIKKCLNEMGKSQIYLAKVFKRRPQQIGQAFQGFQPTLMNKIERHYLLLKEKQNVS